MLEQKSQHLTESANEGQNWVVVAREIIPGARSKETKVILE